MIQATVARKASVLLAALISLTATAAGCLEIEVDPELVPHVPAIPDPGPGAPQVRLHFDGERMDESDWAKALTISRFFFTGVENKSGSPRELLEPAVREVLRQRGYRIAPGGSTGDLVLEIFAERNQLLWLPPREFIQTPKARARGTVRLDLILRSRLLRVSMEGPGENPAEAPGENSGSKETSRELWSGEFLESEELRVLPGEEGNGLAAGAALGFQNYLRWLQIELPPGASAPGQGAAAGAD